MLGPTLSGRREFLALCLSYFFLCYSLFGLFAVLILFFAKHMGLPDSSAYALFGNFSALNYVAEFVGGAIGGWFLTFRAATIIGSVIMLMGFSVLTLHQQMHAMNLGLSFVACGNGLATPNLRNLVGLYFDDSTTAVRDNGFTILHIFNLIGQITGPISLAYLELINVQWIFIAAGASIFLGLINILVHYRYFLGNGLLSNDRVNKARIYKAGVIIAIMLLGTFVILTYRDVKYVLEIALITIVISFAIALIRMDRVRRAKISAVLFILGGLIIAEICFRQTLAVIKFFTEEYVNRFIAHNLIPADMFQALDPIMILFIFPCILFFRKRLEKRGIELDPGISMLIGLTLLGIAFALLVVGIELSTGVKISVSWLFLFYVALALSELFIIPIAMSMVTGASPSDWRGLLMGLLAFTPSLGSYLSGWVGQIISPVKGHPSIKVYAQLFSLLACIAITGGVMLIIAWSLWKKKYSNELLIKL